MKENKRQPWLLRDIFYLYLLTIVLCICGLSVVSLLTGVQIEDFSFGYTVVGIFLLQIIIFCIVIFFVRRVYGAKVQDIGLTTNNVSQGIIYGICGGIILSVVFYVLSLIGLESSSLTGEEFALNVKGSLFFNIIALLDIIVLSPIVEAVVFIGFTYAILIKKFGKSDLPPKKWTPS